MVGCVWADENAFLLAVISDDLKTARNMLEQGLDVDLRFRNGCKKKPPICVSAQRGFREMCKLLIGWGCSINQYDTTGYTALHHASVNGYTELVALLLYNRARVNAITNSGKTALLLVAAHGHIDTIRLLINSGASVNKCDKDYISPLMLAAQNGHLETVQLLLKSGAKVNITDCNGNTALLYAVSPDSAMNPAVVQALIAAKANVNIINSHGDSALFVIIQHSVKNNPKSSKCAELLIHENCFTGQRSGVKQCALHLAAMQQQYDIANILIRHNCHLQCKDIFGRSPVYYLAINSCSEQVDLLIEVGVDLKKEKWIESVESENISKPILDTLTYHYSNTFPSLMLLCRKKIRKMCGRKSDSRLSLFSQYLPDSLVGYLLIKS